MAEYIRKSNKTRPTCELCDHRPFRTDSGLRWHLEHLHPNAVYAENPPRIATALNRSATTSLPTKEDLNQDLGPLGDEGPARFILNHDPLECDHQSCKRLLTSAHHWMSTKDGRYQRMFMQGHEQSGHGGAISFCRDPRCRSFMRIVIDAMLEQLEMDDVMARVAALEKN